MSKKSVEFCHVTEFGTPIIIDGHLSELIHELGPSVGWWITAITHALNCRVSNDDAFGFVASLGNRLLYLRGDYMMTDEGVCIVVSRSSQDEVEHLERLCNAQNLQKTKKKKTTFTPKKSTRTVT